jgi:hypothetical protein
LEEKEEKKRAFCIFFILFSFDARRQVIYKSFGSRGDVTEERERYLSASSAATTARNHRYVIRKMISAATAAPTAKAQNHIALRRSNNNNSTTTSERRVRGGRRLSDADENRNERGETTKVFCSFSRDVVFGGSVTRRATTTTTARKRNRERERQQQQRATLSLKRESVRCRATSGNGSDSSSSSSSEATARRDNNDDASSSYQMKEKFSNETKLRSEAQAPFRVARQFVYASCALSATIGFGIATIQLLTGLAGAPNSPPFDQSLSNVGVDFACAALFAFLWKKDEEAKQKQMSRIGREERLGGLKVELTTGKIVRMQSLRGFSRVVLFAGNLEYLETSLEVAEQYKDELIKKGVFLVPVAMDDEAATKLNKPDNAKKDERRFRGSAVNVSQKDGWRDWILEQKKMAKLGDDVGVYVGLRMDGRVRASGKGVAPFDRFAKELPPVDGGWGGMMDGFDGKVGVDN